MFNAIGLAIIPLTMVASVWVVLMIVILINNETNKKATGLTGVLFDKAVAEWDKSTKVLYIWITSLSLMAAVTFVVVFGYSGYSNDDGQGQKPTVKQATPDVAYKPPAEKAIKEKNVNSTDVQKSEEANQKATEDNNKAMKDATDLFRKAGRKEAGN